MNEHADAEGNHPPTVFEEVGSGTSNTAVVGKAISHST